MEGKFKVQAMNIRVLKEFCEAVTKAPEADRTPGFFEAKQRRVAALWSKVDLANDAIIEGVTAEDMVTVGKEFIRQFEAVQSDYEEVLVMYDKVMIEIHTGIKNLEKKEVQQIQPLQLPENLVLNANKSNIKLKPINIPTFSGDYGEWISFRSMFDSLVHENKEFTKLQKIHYLKSCLDHDAERVLSQFDVTEGSYDDAYATLTDRFHNEVILVDTHIVRILSQPDLKVESSDSLKEMMDVTSENIRALKSLNVETDSWDPILMLLLVPKLDSSTKRLWEQTLKPKVRPTVTEFLEFLRTRFHALGCQQKFKFSMETTSQSNSSHQRKNFNGPYKTHTSHMQEATFPPRVHQSFHSSSRQSCPICSGSDHSIFSCDQFRNAEQHIRREMVDQANLCQRCLRRHQSNCNQREGCRVCGGNHHTFIHIEGQESSSSRQQVTHRISNQSNETNDTSTVRKSHHISVQRSTPSLAITRSTHHVSTDLVKNERKVIRWDADVLLATAIVLIRPLKGVLFHPFRCLFDQASETSHISEAVVQKLGLTKNPISASVTGLGGVSVGSSSSFVEFELGSKLNQNFIMNVQAIVVPKVTNPLPSSFIPGANWKHIEGLQLADPEFYKPAHIDVILGTTVFGYLLLPGLIKASPGVPVAQNTEFGWILSGATELDPDSTTSNGDLKLANKN